MKSYKGNIEPDADTVFVFGSNEAGMHAAGAAGVAVLYFGAQYGVGEGLVGQSYAMPTAEVAKSMSKEDIIKHIQKMYICAQENPDKKFKVAYRNLPNERTLNGYTGREMIDMFKAAGRVPNNVYFSEEYKNNWF